MFEQVDDMFIDAHVRDAMNLARAKLVFDNNISKVEHSNTAMLVILDVLITIDFEPSLDMAHQTQMDMVASHMRTVFSVPDHRLYIHSGYPSEPFLAEAASRQMNLYIRDSPSTMISILKKNLDLGLIDFSQRGELVMRALLMKAYIEAIGAEQVDKNDWDPQPNFSKGCNFLRFLKALFADRYHRQILKATPANGVEEHTFEDAFKHAVVRFTHFVKAFDDSVVRTTAMEAGFVRGSAFICCNHQKEVDLIIPVLLDKHDTVAESSMSALLIQVKVQKRAGGTDAYIMDQETLDFFPDDSTQKSLRPYVTLIAELGVDVTSTSDTLDTGRSTPCTSTDTSSVPEAEHPKYSLRADGCTNKTWNVIHSTEHADYMWVLGGDDFLDYHPRQNKESLRLLRQMLPVWYKDPAWFDDELKSTEMDSSVKCDSGADVC